jgi:hypothetical protein
MSADVRWPLRPLRAGVGVAVLSIAIGHAPPASASGFDEARYWRFADRIAEVLPVTWNGDLGAYFSHNHGYASRTNANLLVLHAVAALRHHSGPTRRDERAQRLVDTMTRPPMLLLPSAFPPHARTVCWGRDLTSSERDHASLDSQIAEALELAFRARRQLGLTDAAAARIRSVVDRCARHPAWRYPNGLVNQINWNAQLYAAAARVTGHHDLLRGDYRRFLARFAAAITRPAPGRLIPNLGPGYGFHYMPTKPAGARLNFDTPEYANIVLSSLRYYAAARHAGMAPLSHHAVHLMRAWVTRVIAGSWTHAGYLNWDTGYGWHRWHSGQYWAFAQQGLLGIASARRFWARPEYGSWIKAIFDHGLELYERWGREAGGVRAPQNTFDVRSEHRDVDLYAARIAANAARAIVLGLGSKRAQDPPPLYAFDVETGRLGVSTPSYSTAIVPDNRGAFAYGGIDLARLFGRGLRVAANIGGEPPSTFGAIVRDATGHELLASQHGRERRGHVWLTRSPRGPVSRSSGARFAAHPYAGTFHELEARGTIAAGGLRIGTDYGFAPRHIDARWNIRCVAGCQGLTVDLLLPTWGAEAHVDAIRRDGTTTRLAGAGKDRDTLPLRAVARLDLGRGARGGYVAVPLGRSRHGLLHTIQPRWQHTDTHPGPTLAIRLVAHRRFRHTSFALRLVPRGGRETRGAA